MAVVCDVWEHLMAVVLACRFNASTKFVNPPNPEDDKSVKVQNAPAFWAWVDTAIAETQRLLHLGRWVVGVEPSALY